MLRQRFCSSCGESKESRNWKQAESWEGSGIGCIGTDPKRKCVVATCHIIAVQWLSISRFCDGCCLGHELALRPLRNSSVSKQVCSHQEHMKPTPAILVHSLQLIGAYTSLYRFTVNFTLSHPQGPCYQRQPRRRKTFTQPRDLIPRDPTEPKVLVSDQLSARKDMHQHRHRTRSALFQELRPAVRQDRRHGHDAATRCVGAVEAIANTLVHHANVADRFEVCVDILIRLRFMFVSPSAKSLEWCGI